MAEQIHILKCILCGNPATVYKTDSDMRRPYYVECSGCNRKTANHSHVETAVEAWNKKQQLIKVKPKYLCGNCGEMIPFGFAICPNCGTEVDWS